MSHSIEIVVHPGGHRTLDNRRRGAVTPSPTIVSVAGGGGEFGWDEVFKGQFAEAHTRENDAHAVHQFLGWCGRPDRAISRFNFLD